MSRTAAFFPVLAQVARSSRELGKDITLLVVLFVLMLVLFLAAGIVIYVVRSRALRNSASKSDIPLTLAELRRMHASGEIDDTEMERLKGIVTAQAKRDILKPPPAPKE
jgi:hypothetical protein